MRYPNRWCTLKCDSIKHKGSIVDSKAIQSLIIEAGKIAIHYQKNGFAITEKADGTPVTEADLAVNQMICKGLATLTPDVPVISEENELLPYAQRKDWEAVWLLDPIDGTRSFINQTDGYVISLGLVRSGTPVLGLIYQPTSDRLYVGDPKTGLWVHSNGNSSKIHPRQSASDKMVVVGSSHDKSEQLVTFVNDIEKQTDIAAAYHIVGSAIKFCLVAEGSADMYPKFGQTWEWDTAAGQAILMAVGKNLYTWDTKSPLIYNKEQLTNPPFIAN